MNPPLNDVKIELLGLFNEHYLLDLLFQFYRELSAVSIADDAVIIRDLRSGELLEKMVGQPGTRLIWFAVDGDTGSILAGAGDTAWVWSITNRKLQGVFCLETPLPFVQFLALSRRGRKIVFACGNRVQVHAVADFAVSALLECSANVKTVAISGDARTIASGDSTRTVRIWRENERGCFDSWVLTHLDVRIMLLSDDGQLIYLCPRDAHHVQIWSVDRKALIAKLTGHAGAVIGILVSRDRSRIVTSSCDKTIRVWSSADFTQLTCITNNANNCDISCIALLPNDNDCILSSCFDATVRLWNTSSSALVHSFQLSDKNETRVVGIA